MLSEEFTFRKFAENPFYQRINSWLVESVNPGSGQRIVDLACGTGLVTRLIVERLRGARDTVVIGIDQSATALREAMDELTSASELMVQFIQSQVEQMSVAVRESVDTVIFGNGIHYIQDKRRLLSDIFTSLRPGGTFAFNTSFYEGGNPPESEQFRRRWMYKSLRNLRSTYGLSPEKEKVESRKQLTPQQYRQLLEEQGFRIAKEEEVTIEVPLEGWVDISEYEDFISGTLPGVPLDKASYVLQEAARQTFDELNLNFVLRNWLQIVAVRQ